MNQRMDQITTADIQAYIKKRPDIASVELFKVLDQCEFGNDSPEECFAEYHHRRFDPTDDEPHFCHREGLAALKKAGKWCVKKGLVTQAELDRLVEVYTARKREDRELTPRQSLKLRRIWAWYGNAEGKGKL